MSIYDTLFYLDVIFLNQCYYSGTSVECAVLFPHVFSLILYQYAVNHLYSKPETTSFLGKMEVYSHSAFAHYFLS